MPKHETRLELLFSTNSFTIYYFFLSSLGFSPEKYQGSSLSFVLCSSLYQHSYTFLTKMVNRVVISLVHHQNPFTSFSKLHTPFLLTLLLSWVCFCCTLRALCVADLELNFFYTALSDHKRAKPDSFRGQTDGPDTCCRLVHPGKFTTSGLFAQMHIAHYSLLFVDHNVHNVHHMYVTYSKLTSK